MEISWAEFYRRKSRLAGFGCPAEFVNVVVYLASDDSAFAVGSKLMSTAA
jgi:hypothetical protein